MAKEDKFEVVSAKYKGERVYYTNDGYTSFLDDAKVFKNGGGFLNSTGDGIYRLKMKYNLNEIGIEELSKAKK
jgi:hypothetical protein